MAVVIDGTSGITTPSVDSTGASTFTGALALPAGGLNVGSGQLAVDASGRVTMASQPAFAVQKGNNNVPATGTPIIFATTVFDTGSNYNTATGVFTAPVAGKYLFNFSGITHSVTNYLYVWFSKNGVNLEWTDIHLPQTVGEYDFLAMSHVIDLSANDTVSVRQGYNGGSPYFEGSRCGFSGFLIG